MLAAVVRDTMSQLDEVRLPLHILLETRFGDLNENQEELLRDARTGADAMAAALQRLAQVTDADRGALTPKRELVQVNDVVRAILPLARNAAERRNVRVEAALEPGLPRVLADRARLAESLSLLGVGAASIADQQHPLTISTARDGTGVAITLAPWIHDAASPAGATAPTTRDGDGASAPAPADAADVPTLDASAATLAQRLITAQGGSTETTPAGIVVRLRGSDQ